VFRFLTFTSNLTPTFYQTLW